MRYTATIIGGALVGTMVFGIWPEMWKSYGIFGGWLAGFVIIGFAWFLNHWLGVTHNPDGKVWIDQGWAVAAAGIAWTAVRFGAPLYQAAGPILFIGLGGLLGGIAAYAVKKTTPASQPPEEGE